MIKKALNIDEMKKTFKREDQNKQSVSRRDPVHCSGERLNEGLQK